MYSNYQFPMYKEAQIESLAPNKIYIKLVSQKVKNIKKTKKKRTILGDFAKFNGIKKTHFNNLKWIDASVKYKT